MLTVARGLSRSGAWPRTSCLLRRLASRTSEEYLADLGAPVPPPPPGLSPDQNAGRDLARLALMEKTMRQTIADVASRGEYTPDLLVDLEAASDEAVSLITGALDASGRPCTPDQLADRVNRDVVAIPPNALNYRELLRVGELRDLMETCLAHMNIMPPLESMLDGANKPFCRLDRQALRRKEFEEALAKTRGNGDGEESPAESGSELAIELGTTALSRSKRPLVSPGEIERRKAELEAAAKIENVLRGFDTALLDVRRVCKVTRGGTTLSMRALVVIGNGAGTAGYGEGKSDTPQHAIERACRDAKRNLLYIDRYDDRTLYHGAVGKYVRSRVTLWPAPPGSGISANNNFSAVFQLFGLRDVGAKLHGPRSLTNSVKALFNGLSKIRSAEEVASARGLRLASNSRFSYSRRPLVNQRVG